MELRELLVLLVYMVLDELVVYDLDYIKNLALHEPLDETVQIIYDELQLLLLIDLLVLLEQDEYDEHDLVVVQII